MKIMLAWMTLTALVMLAAPVWAKPLPRVPLWHTYDVRVFSQKHYDNPYAEAEIEAVFTHESGETVRLYGFWNGGDEWRVRFAPTRLGHWNYVVHCSDKDNRGLEGAGGTINAVPNDRKTELDRHGFVRISDDGRRFVYDDGTPFFWLGDTNWQAPNYVSTTRCNYPGCSCSNQFRHEVDDRLRKGFTVYQTYFDSAESDGGGQLGINPEPSMWAIRHKQPDTRVFSEKYDAMFDYLAEKGMVIALGFGVHSITTEAMSAEDLDRLTRYLTARYAAYPVIWITAQEIPSSPPGSAPPGSPGRETATATLRAPICSPYRRTTPTRRP